MQLLPFDDLITKININGLAERIHIRITNECDVVITLNYVDLTDEVDNIDYTFMNQKELQVWLLEKFGDALKTKLSLLYKYLNIKIEKI